jgi:energy-coupling factor transport system ATP-binding protein
MSWIEIQDFSYTYPGEQSPALLNINMTVEQGEFIVIAGASGSGKSTLGKALAGFLFQDEHPQYAGKIDVNGTDMTQVTLFHASQRVAYAQQNPEDQFCTLSVLDEIAFALENACLQPEEIERRIDQALGVVKGLNLRDRQLATLSGGEKQKVAIASMLALSPDVLVLDEPTSNLDPGATQHVFETLHSLIKQKDLTVIIIEHKLSQLMGINPKLIVIDSGKITAETYLTEYAPVVPLVPDSVLLSQKQSGLPDPSLLEVSHLDVSLNGQEILHDISFCLHPGEFVAMMGPNGSGKSTLLQTLMGFHQPVHGELKGFNRHLTKTKTSSLVKDIGFIFQNPDHQIFTQSVRDEATLTVKHLNLMNDQMHKKVDEYMDEIGVHARLDDHPQRLSFGEKRRLNLVAVILHNPKLLLIDEFLIGQDMRNAHKWMQWLRHYTAEGHTILMVNHHANLTQIYCDRVIFLDAGSVIVDAPVSSAFPALEAKGYRPFLPHNEEMLAYA